MRRSKLRSELDVFVNLATYKYSCTSPCYSCPFNLNVSRKIGGRCAIDHTISMHYPVKIYSEEFYEARSDHAKNMLIKLGREDLLIQELL